MDPDTNHQPKVVGTGQIEAVRVTHDTAGEAFVPAETLRYYEARGWVRADPDPEPPKPSRSKRATKEK